MLALSLLGNFMIALSGAPGALHGPDGPLNPGIMLSMMAAWFALSLGTALAQVVGGVGLLLRKKNSYANGLVAGVASLVSIWQIFLYPFCFALGIYAMFVLLGTKAKEQLSTNMG